MKHHLMIVFGLILAGIFTWRASDAFADPGFGLRELYVLGGFVISAALVWSGIREWRAGRSD